MRRCFGLWFLGLFVPLTVGAVLEGGGPTSARSAALGEAVGALSESPLKVNPAGLAGATWGVASSQVRLLGESDFSRQSVQAYAPSGLGSWGVAYQRFGPSFFREEEWRIGQGLSLGNSRFGWSLGQRQLSQDHYGRTQAWTLGVGSVWPLSDMWTLGGWAQQVNAPQWSGRSDRLSPRLGVAVSGRPLKAITLLGQSEMDQGPLLWRVGGEFRATSQVFFRFGMKTAPARFSGGLGLKFGQLKLDYAFVSHPQLLDEHFFTLSWGGLFSDP